MELRNGQINAFASCASCSRRADQCTLCDDPSERGMNFLNYHVLDNWLCISMCEAQLDMFNLYAPFLDEQLLTF